MIYLELFFAFFSIGAVSFGGGYGMLSLLREQVLSHGWLSESRLLDMIAVAESTPGPIAVNMATFIGSARGGALGAAVATLGVVLPSFFVILVIAALLQRLMRYAPVKAFLAGLRPSVVSLILSTAILLALGTLFGVSSFSDTPSVEARGISVLLALAAISLGYRRVRKRALPPIPLILCSAVLGILFYGVI